MASGPPGSSERPHTFPPKAPTSALRHAKREFHFSHSQLYFYSRVASNQNVQSRTNESPDYTSCGLHDRTRRPGLEPTPQPGTPQGGGIQARQGCPSRPGQRAQRAQLWRHGVPVSCEEYGVAGGSGGPGGEAGGGLEPGSESAALLCQGVRLDPTAGVGNSFLPRASWICITPSEGHPKLSP